MKGKIGAEMRLFFPFFPHIDHLDFGIDYKQLKLYTMATLRKECHDYVITLKNTCRDKNSQDVLDFVFDYLSTKYNFGIKDINKAFDEAYEIVGF